MDLKYLSSSLHKLKKIEPSISIHDKFQTTFLPLKTTTQYLNQQAKKGRLKAPYFFQTTLNSRFVLFSGILLQGKACFEIQLRHADDKTLADTVFKLVCAFDTAPRCADLRAAVVLVFLTRIQDRLLFDQTAVSDLPDFPVPVGNFPKPLAQCDNFIAAVADGDLIIKSIAITINIALSGDITRLYTDFYIIHFASP